MEQKIKDLKQELEREKARYKRLDKVCIKLMNSNMTYRRAINSIKEALVETHKFGYDSFIQTIINSLDLTIERAGKDEQI